MGESSPVKGTIRAADNVLDIHLVSVGSKDGVKISDRYVVFRSGRFVALVQVDKVFEDKCSVVVCKVGGKPERVSDIWVGDSVESGY